MVALSRLYVPTVLLHKRDLLSAITTKGTYLAGIPPLPMVSLRSARLVQMHQMLIKVLTPPSREINMQS